MPESWIFFSLDIIRRESTVSFVVRQVQTPVHIATIPPIKNEIVIIEGRYANGIVTFENELLNNQGNADPIIDPIPIKTVCTAKAKSNLMFGDCIDNKRTHKLMGNISNSNQ